LLNGLLLAGLALPLAIGCGSFVQLKSKTAANGPAKSTVAPIVYDDFEKGMGGSYAYAAPEGASCSATEETTVVHSGTKAQKNTFKTGTGSWGCGYGWTTAYMPKEGYFNAKGTIGIEFWAKAARGIAFQISFKESKGNGGDEEVWQAPFSTGAGTWKKYFIPYDSFTRGIYSGNQAGDDTLERGSIASMDVQLDTKQGDGEMYIDDIYFK
jgi:hypothetical protein